MKYFIIILLLISTNLFGQFKLKDLQGYWVCPNQDSAYFKNDTLVLKQYWDSVKYDKEFERSKYCSFYDWFIHNKEIYTEENNYCVEPTTNTSSFLNNKIEILKSNRWTFLLVEQYSGSGTDLFLVLQYRKDKINKKQFRKTLVLKKIYKESRIIIR